MLRPAPPMDDSRRATSFGAFLKTTDSYWPSCFATDRDAPIFADHEDSHKFYAGCGNPAHVPQLGRINDFIKLTRRSDQFVSMSRFSEGSVFDRSGMSRGSACFLHTAMAPWLSNEADGLWVAEEALATAPCHEQSYLIFYNGNLHNYYHWLVEGLLSLDILSRALGLNSNLKIALPKSMDINALIDHRETLRAVGLDKYEIIEVAENLIRVQEAIWVDNDIIETMPAPYLKDFQQRISALYAGLRRPRNRRLLVARRGPARAIHNIEQVQTFLSRYDFETVYLEGTSMVDQILLFQSAEFIITPHGAGMANLLFCEPGTKVIEFMPAVELRPFFWMMSEKLDLVHGMQFCDSVGEQNFQAAISVDIGKLQALLRMFYTTTTEPSAPLSLEPLDRSEHTSLQGRLSLRPAPPMDDSRRAPSFDAFLQATDSYWPSDFTTDRDGPIFADHADMRRFYSGNADRAQSPRVGAPEVGIPQVGGINDCLKLIKRSDQFVSMWRSMEGSVFDRSGVSRGVGHLLGTITASPPWLSKEADDLCVGEESLATAPYYEQSFLIFYDGGLRNYYHWLAEGLLSLDILSRALGLSSNLKIALPKSTDIDELFDHRETLRAVGLDKYEIIEVSANLIRVQEAIWVDNQNVNAIPAPYLKDFQQRISALYAGLRRPRNRRLLIARKGTTRTIHNIDQVQALLSGYDFETVYLEGMSMVDQILLFQSAEFIISPHGAGLANLLFCEPGTKVIELAPSVEMRQYFWLISEKLGLVHALQFCTTVPDQNFNGALNVDIRKLQALLRMVDAHL